jgi:hypothetical protein
MCANRCWLVTVAAVALMSWGGTAMAQMSMLNPTPVSRISGYAGHEMSSIYQQSIGTGYTAKSEAQNLLYQSQASVPYVGQSVGYGGSVSWQTLAGPASKPFANVTPTPTVSPWMNMFRDDLSGADALNYQTLVRPMLNQQQVNHQLERQNIELGQRVQAMSARNAYNPQGSDQIYPTGHPTVFMVYGHYYPAPRGKGGRR